MSAAEFDEKTLERAECCKSKCTVCVKGRAQERGFWHSMVKLESSLKLCPWCRAYSKVYGVPPHENPTA